MPVRKTPVWRVQSGTHSRWFWEEDDARDYANNRYEYDLDGVPFISQMSNEEMLVRLNQLEMSNEDMS